MRPAGGKDRVGEWPRLSRSIRQQPLRCHPFRGYGSFVGSVPGPYGPGYPMSAHPGLETTTNTVAPRAGSSRLVPINEDLRSSFWHPIDTRARLFPYAFARGSFFSFNHLD